MTEKGRFSGSAGEGGQGGTGKLFRMGLDTKSYSHLVNFHIRSESEEKAAFTSGNHNNDIESGIIFAVMLLSAY